MRQESTQAGHAGDSPLLTAADMIRWRRAGEPLPRLPEAAIITHQGYLLPRRRPWQRRPELTGFSFDLRSTAGGALTLAGVRGVGAPATAVAIEELAAAGVRRLVAVDIGGSLAAVVPSGSIVLVESALACDGTSPHYARSPEVQADEGLMHGLERALTSDGVEFTRGPAWSTDAVYREMPTELDEARAKGAVIADMETACVFAVSAALGLEAGALLVAADELYDGWRPPADARHIQAQVRSALAVATACLLPS